jgi:hypothetical protein
MRGRKMSRIKSITFEEKSVSMQDTKKSADDTLLDKGNFLLSDKLLISGKLHGMMKHSK